MSSIIASATRAVLPMGLLGLAYSRYSTGSVANCEGGTGPTRELSVMNPSRNALISNFMKTIPTSNMELANGVACEVRSCIRFQTNNLNEYHLPVVHKISLFVAGSGRDF